MIKIQKEISPRNNRNSTSGTRINTLERFASRSPYIRAINNDRKGKKSQFLPAEFKNSEQLPNQNNIQASENEAVLQSLSDSDLSGVFQEFKNLENQLNESGKLGEYSTRQMLRDEFNESGLQHKISTGLRSRILNLKKIPSIDTKLKGNQFESTAVNIDFTNRAATKNVNLPEEFDLEQGKIIKDESDKSREVQSPETRLRGIMQQMLISRMVNVSEFQVAFQPQIFIKFMLYHVLFFYCGPLACIPVLLFDSKHTMNNMSFWFTTLNKPSFIVQVFQWISCMTVIGSWVQKLYNLFPIVEIELKYIFIEQLFFFNMMVIIRSFIIAVRYGFTSKFRLSMLTKHSQELGFITQDLLIPQWINLNPEGLDLEVEAAMWRNLVEPETFRITFIEDLLPDMAQKLSQKNYYQKDEKIEFSMKDYKKQINTYKNSIRKRQQSLDKIDIYDNDYEMFGLHSTKNVLAFTKKEKTYLGTLLLREIALFAGAHQRSTKLFLIVTVFGKLFLPFIARYFIYGTLELEWDSIIYTCFDTVASSVFLMQNYFFLAAGHVDFQRRYYMMKATSALINPFKEGYSIMYQLFPTINLVSKESLQTWFQLRCCVMDFGRKYMKRIFVYSSVFLGMYLFYAVFILLSFFQIIDYQFSLIANLICIFDIVVGLGVIISMFHYGAIINDQFKEDKFQLIKIKQTLIYIRFNLSQILNPKKKYSSAYLKIFQKIFLQLKETKSYDQIITHIDEVNMQIDAINDRLDIEGEQRPLSLLGLKATYSLMNQIYTTIFTIIAAVLQRFFTS